MRRVSVYVQKNPTSLGLKRFELKTVAVMNGLSFGTHHVSNYDGMN